MAEIIERIAVDVEDMPEWMQEAFRTGRVYHTCVKKVAELEAAVEQLKAHTETVEKYAVQLEAECEILLIEKAELLMKVTRLQQEKREMAWEIRDLKKD
jgi:uncharacterized protein YhaN